MKTLNELIELIHTPVCDIENPFELRHYLGHGDDRQFPIYNDPQYIDWVTRREVLQVLRQAFAFQLSFQCPRHNNAKHKRVAITEGMLRCQCKVKYPYEMWAPQLEVGSDLFCWVVIANASYSAWHRPEYNFPDMEPYNQATSQHKDYSTLMHLNSIGARPIDEFIRRHQFLTEETQKYNKDLRELTTEHPDLMQTMYADMQVREATFVAGTDAQA